MFKEKAILDFLSNIKYSTQVADNYFELVVILQEAVAY